jgi:hypothetical protein
LIKVAGSSRSSAASLDRMRQLRNSFSEGSHQDAMPEERRRDPSGIVFRNEDGRSPSTPPPPEVPRRPPILLVPAAILPPPEGARPASAPYVIAVAVALLGPTLARRSIRGPNDRAEACPIEALPSDGPTTAAEPPTVPAELQNAAGRADRRPPRAGSDDDRRRRFGARRAGAGVPGAIDSASSRPRRRWSPCRCATAAPSVVITAAAGSATAARNPILRPLDF